MGNQFRLCVILFCLAVASPAQEFPRQEPRERTDQLRSLGDPGPIPPKEQRELIRKVKEQQKEWKRGYQKDWKAYQKAEGIKYKEWTRASMEERRQYQENRRKRGLEEIPQDLLYAIHPRM